MRQATLGLFYVVKYLELTFLIIWTGLIFNGAFFFIDQLTEQTHIESNDRMAIIFVGISLVLILWNLFYNNLLINLRFLAKMRCVTLGLCLFDAFNFLFCYCFLVKPCRDRCFTPWTLVKWLIKGGIIGTAIYYVRQKKEDWDEDFVIGGLDDEKSDTMLDIYLIVYLLQHPLFIVARFPIFLIYSILTCCCDKGQEFNDDEKFEDRILSFDFVPFELGRLNNFENHPVGRNEFEYNRRLSVVRAQSIRNRPDAAPAAPANQSFLDRAQARLGGTIYATLGAKPSGECPICYMQMQPGEKIAQLACHPMHQLHEHCYQILIQHNAGRADLKLCPLCRAPINEAAVQKKVFQEIKPTDMKTEDAFALAGVPSEDLKKGKTIDNMERELDQIQAGHPEPVASEANLIQPSNAAPMVMPPSGPPAAHLNGQALAANASADVALPAAQSENQPQNAILPGLGPNRGGTVHIDELPIPARGGDDSDIPEPME